MLPISITSPTNKSSNDRCFLGRRILELALTLVKTLFPPIGNFSRILGYQTVIEE